MTSLVVALAATVAMLGGVVWSGLARRRGLHYALVAAMLLCLVLAVWRAEVYGRGLVFEGVAAAARGVHFAAVALTVLLLALVVASGWKLARAHPAGRRVPADSPERLSHRRRAVQFVVLVAITCALGITMTALARPA